MSNNPWQKMAETDRKVFAICISAAFIFWLILNLSQEYTVQREVTLEYLVSPDRVLIGNMPATIETDIKGQGWGLIWENLRPGPINIIYDATGEDNNRLSRSDLELQIERKLSSGGLSVENMDFESVPILTTPLGGKRVPIIADITTKAAKGCIIVDSLKIGPDSITINAANDVLEDINSWKTVRVELPNLKQTTSASVDLVAPPEGVTLSRNSTDYTVKAEAYIQKTLSVPIRIENAPTGSQFEVTPREVDITVNVPQSFYDQITAADFTVVADVSQRKDGSDSPSIAIELVEQPRAVINAYLGERMVTLYKIK